MILGQACQQIEAGRVRQIGGIEPDEIIPTAARKQAHRGFGQIAMRIEEGQPATGCEILRDQIEQQRRFPGPRLADDVEMAGPCIGRQEDRLAKMRTDVEAVLDIEKGHDLR